MRVLACGAHADDVELGCGGALALCAEQGHQVAILDLTAGELASNGSVQERAAEAARAAAILGAASRDNAGLPDGQLRAGDPEQRGQVVAWIRKLRPDLVIAPPAESRHPDHRQAGALLLEACFLAGLRRFPAAGEPHRPRLFLEYMERMPFRPDFVLAIDGVAARKDEALRCYASQFARSAGAAPTRINAPGFLAEIAERDRYFGVLAGCGRGEPFRARDPLCLADLAAILPAEREERTWP